MRERSAKHLTAAVAAAGDYLPFVKILDTTRENNVTDTDASNNETKLN